MLVMSTMDIDLRNYLQQNHNQLRWKERIQIVVNIISALYRIHKENAIHRDLHSGNVLFDKSYLIKLIIRLQTSSSQFRFALSTFSNLLSTTSCALDSNSLVKCCVLESHS